jgi:hypothetical protein
MGCRPSKQLPEPHVPAAARPPPRSTWVWMIHPDGSRTRYAVSETTTTEDALAAYRRTGPDATGLVMGCWRLVPGATLFSACIEEGISLRGLGPCTFRRARQNTNFFARRIGRLNVI